MASTTYQKIIEIVSAKYQCPKDALTPQTSLEDLGLDELDCVELIMDIENQFNITIPDNLFFTNSSADSTGDLNTGLQLASIVEACENLMYTPSSAPTTPEAVQSEISRKKEERIPKAEPTSSQSVNMSYEKKKDEVKESSKTTCSPYISALADMVRPEKEILTQEEERLKRQLNECRDKKEKLKYRLRNLLPVDHPGQEPDKDKYVKETFQVLSSILVIGVVILFILHCIIWFFKLFSNISWNTWGWLTTFLLFGIGVDLIGCIFSYLFYSSAHTKWEEKKDEYDQWYADKTHLEKEIAAAEQKEKRLEQELNKIFETRKEVLIHLYRQNLQLPMRSLAEWEYSDARKRYFHLLDEKTQLRSLTLPEEKLRKTIEWYNHKLRVFMDVSIKSEATNKKVYDSFKEVVTRSIQTIRQDWTPRSLSAPMIKDMIWGHRNYTPDFLSDYVSSFKEVAERDVSGFFTKTDSALLEEQVNDLEKIYYATRSVLEQYSAKVESIFNTLGLGRLVAYRNIYFGVEILNIVRENAGGGGLSVTIDDLGIGSDWKIDLSSFEIEVFSMEAALKEITSAIGSDLSEMIGRGLSDKNVRNYAFSNPRQSAAAIGMVTLFSATTAGIEALKRRNAKVEGLTQKLTLLLEHMSIAVDMYLDLNSKAERALELIQAILKANDGFTAVYAPLRDKIFGNLNIGEITNIEIMYLTKAIKTYKTISESQL